ARQKEVMGTSMFSSGYISRNPNANDRPHHYNMNLVFFDQIYTHFKWTRDIDFLKSLWPTLERNMKWEKRNYDADGDGLYDAYAAIWASDALQYSGGGVTHTTAYNYRANIEMARLAKIIGKDPKPYEKEAEHILHAVKRTLWLKNKGWYAEYIDKSGNKMLHEQPGLWSIYHAIDSKVPDNFEAYQALRYIDTQIPHIPIKAKGLEDKGYYTLSTTNWHPYTWSVNNVALAELMNTSLAYWQGNRSEEAFKLWESALIESMYLGASPGNFQQLSFYDAMRGELYRDFADPVGMTGRALIEGLFGIQPDAFNNTLLIQPGLPKSWDHASLDIPDALVSFQRNGDIDTYKVVSRFPFSMNLKLQLKAYRSGIKNIWVNGKKASWSLVEHSVGFPQISIDCGSSAENNVQIEWVGKMISKYEEFSLSVSDGLTLTAAEGDFLEVIDPQRILDNIKLASKKIQARIKNSTGSKTLFVKVRNGDLIWYKPYHITLNPDIYVVYNKDQAADQINFDIISNTSISNAELSINPGFQHSIKKVNLVNGKNTFSFSRADVIPGSNQIVVKSNNKTLLDTTVINWNIKPVKIKEAITVDLSGFYNNQITRIFENKYLTPRPAVTTLQLPVQGIGNWCYPLIKPVLEDDGLKNKLAENGGKIPFNEKIAFAIREGKAGRNVVFTSQWDNFPTKVNIPLTGTASHIYLLMGGSTNPMQSRIVNGVVSVEYTDGTKKVMELRNPDNWWPIEQDYYIDDYAFAIETPRPPRLYLKTGEFKLNNSSFYAIKGFSNYGVNGGAITLLDMPSDKEKKLKSITLETKANDVVIGLIAITLVR
ncbi:glycogen debranching protein, partial [Pseudopedobacter sp.]|uniref:glycogen debranching protein n=1 Tax=Pseudopedobacter sp. TaxID=1936787 RepID=UPI00333F08A9